MNYRLPPEWAPHAATLVAWPAARDLWQDDLPAAQIEWGALCKAITAAPANGSPDKLFVVVRNELEADEARNRLSEVGVDPSLQRFLFLDYGDIWLRDTAPLFAVAQRTTAGPQADLPDEEALPEAIPLTLSFRFNGWGEKYQFPGDRLLAKNISHCLKMDQLSFDLCTEGGALEWNDEGLLLTTESCLVDAKRNLGLSRADIERQLLSALQLERVIWLKRGLINDHTDGHIDTLVRFAPNKTIVLMVPKDRDDPQTERLLEIRESILKALDVLPDYRLIELPSPGKILSSDGHIMPASYTNFYISNGAVAVPIYGSPHDEEATRIISECFPDRPTVGLSARAILTGGGAFHCITQQICLLSKSDQK